MKTIISICLEDGWVPADPLEFVMFDTDSVILSTLEACNVHVLIDDDLVELIEMTIGETRDGRWIWASDVDVHEGFAPSREAARALAEAVAWSTAVEHVSKINMSPETVADLYRIVGSAASDCRKRRRRR